MAINPSVKYPGRITAPDANYNYGSSQDETSPGAGDGTPYEVARANDIFGLQQALLRSASIVPTNSAETQLASQYLQAFVELASGRAINYDESGIVNAYELDLRTNQQGPAAYFDGMRAEFTPSIANTGASTVNVATLGVKNIFFNGAALVGGELSTTAKATIEYDLTNDRYNLEHAEVPGFVRSGNNYTKINKLIADIFVINTVIGTAFESVGPTGSGATNIWVELDNLPANTKAVKLKFHNSLSGTTAGVNYKSSIMVRKTGESDIVDNSAMVSVVNFTGVTGITQRDGNITESLVPLDPSNRFDIANTTLGSTSGLFNSMIITGFEV